MDSRKIHYNYLKILWLFTGGIGKSSHGGIMHSLSLFFFQIISTEHYKIKKFCLKTLKKSLKK